MDLVDEQHIAFFEVGEDGRQVARASDGRSGGGANGGAQLVGHHRGERGLAQPWRAREQDMVRRLAAPLGRRDHDAEGFLHLRLAQIVVEPFRAQGEIQLQVVLGERRGHRAVAPERRCRALRFRAVPRGLEHHALYVQIECHDFLSTSQTFQGVL